MQRVSFDQFLDMDMSSIQFNYAAQVKGSPIMVWELPDKFGTGRIVTVPLVGGSGLVVMEACFCEDIEIYAEQTVQESLSFTVCLEGSLINRRQEHNDITVKQYETLFGRNKDGQKEMSSYFKKGEQNCFITIYLSPDWIKTDKKNSELDVLTNSFWEGVYNSGLASQMMMNAASEVVSMTRKPDIQLHYISAKVLELWAHQVSLLRKLSLPQCCPMLKAHDVAIIHQAAEILMQDMINPPSLLGLSRHIGINDNKLKKGFKQVYGTTVFGFLRQHRLQKAKHLISENQCNVMQAASAVGFKSAGHFSTVFKQTFGVTPRQFIHSVAK